MIVILQMQQSEFGSIPQFSHELLSGKQIFVLEWQIITKLRASRPEAQCIGRIFLDHLLRFNNVSQGLRHFFSVRVLSMAGDHHILPWSTLIMVITFNHGIKQPSSDNIMRLRAKIKCLIMIFEIIFSFTDPITGNFWGNGRSGPGIENISLSFELGRTAGASLARLLCSWIYG